MSATYTLVQPKSISMTALSKWALSSSSHWCWPSWHQCSSRLPCRTLQTLRLGSRSFWCSCICSHTTTPTSVGSLTRMLTSLRSLMAHPRVSMQSSCPQWSWPAVLTQSDLFLFFSLWAFSFLVSAHSSGDRWGRFRWFAMRWWVCLPLRLSRCWSSNFTTCWHSYIYAAWSSSRVGRPSFSFTAILSSRMTSVVHGTCPQWNNTL